jgi:hypothetical protein
MVGQREHRRSYPIESELQEIAGARSSDSRPATELPRYAPEDATPFAEIQKQFPKATERRLMWAHKHRGLWVDLLPARDKAGDVRDLLHASLAEVKALLEDLEAAAGRTVANPYLDPSGLELWPPELHRRNFGIRGAWLGAIRRSKKAHPALGSTIRYVEPSKVPLTIRGDRNVFYYAREDGLKLGEWLKRTTPLEQAKEFLLLLVANGPVEGSKSKKQARKAGIAKTTLQRAREALQEAGRFKTSRVGYQGHKTKKKARKAETGFRTDSGSYWHLPDDEPPAAPPVSVPHPKLDRAMQILKSVPDCECDFPEAVRRAEQEGISRTTVQTAREMIRRAEQGNPTPATEGANGTQIPDQAGPPTAPQLLGSDRRESAAETASDKRLAADSLADMSTRAPRAPKRSTQKGEARVKLVSALTKHHRYADGSALNLEPIGNNELARQAGVSESSASAFFDDKFKGYTKYKTVCRDSGLLVAALKLLNDEFAPHNLYDREPAYEGGRDSEGDE